MHTGPASPAKNKPTSRTHTVMAVMTRCDEPEPGSTQPFRYYFLGSDMNEHEVSTAPPPPTCHVQLEQSAFVQ